MVLFRRFLKEMDSTLRVLLDYCYEAEHFLNLEIESQRSLRDDYDFFYEPGVSDEEMYRDCYRKSFEREEELKRTLAHIEKMRRRFKFLIDYYNLFRKQTRCVPDICLNDSQIHFLCEMRRELDREVVKFRKYLEERIPYLVLRKEGKS